MPEIYVSVLLPAFKPLHLFYFWSLGLVAKERDSNIVTLGSSSPTETDLTVIVLKIVLSSSMLFAKSILVVSTATWQASFTYSNSIIFFWGAQAITII